MIKKKVPMRKCTGCQEMKNKKPGRGAYVCRNIECLEKACKNKGLERSFKTSVPKDLYEELKKQLGESNE